MNNQDTSFLSRTYNPLLQGGVILGFSIVMMILGKVVSSLGIYTVGIRQPWMCAAAGMLLFAVFNSVFSLAAPKMSKYWGKSVYAFLVLTLGASLSAWFFSSITIGEAGSYRWIFIVVAIGYLIFISIMGFLRKIVEFAEREEWSQPRQRRKKKRQNKDNRPT